MEPTPVPTMLVYISSNTYPDFRADTSPFVSVSGFRPHLWIPRTFIHYLNCAKRLASRQTQRIAINTMYFVGKPNKNTKLPNFSA